ncbi:nitroreductase family protein [Micromonospora sp. ATA32]|nr:nitroreductase family protein [Micromonospora sp. ATA32]
MDDNGLALTRSGLTIVIRVPQKTGREVLAHVNGDSDGLSLAGRRVLTNLDQHGVLTTEVVHDQQVIARHEPGIRSVGRGSESGWVRPVRTQPATHLRFGPDGPELAGSLSGDRVILTSTWAVEFAARLIARAGHDSDGDLESELLCLMSRASLLITDAPDRACDTWEFHDSVFHAATRLDTSFGDYGAKIEPAPFVPDVAVPRPATDKRLILNHDERAAKGLTLRDAISARSTVRDHGGAPIGRAELSALFDASLRVRKLERTATNERAWRAIPTGGALSGLSAVVIAGAVSDLARGAYEYDAVSHDLAPASGPSPAIDRWFGLAQRLTGIPSAAIQAMILFTLDYGRPAHSYGSIVYASTLKEVGAALEAMALVSVDLGLSFCPMGGGFGTTAGLGKGIRSAAVVGEAVIGRPDGAP